jgi:gamma-glutamyltranspeptidase/glutathione hydrolase
VAAGHEHTAQAAELVLCDGGNAFDAVLAAYFAACVAEPILVSLGGGGFLLAQTVDRQPWIHDFFVQTPRRQRPSQELDFRPIVADFGTAQQEFHIGLGSIAVPGAIRGLFGIHRELCSMPMRELVQPATDLGRTGVPVDALQAYIFSIIEPIYLSTPAAREIYESHRSPGHLLGEGEILRMPELAQFLETLAIEGEDLFYRGEVAEWIAATCRSSGGHLTIEDLLAYEGVRREALQVDYRRARVFTNPPPSSGGILIAFALRMLEVVPAEQFVFGTAAYLRLLAEVMALTQRARIEAHLDATTRQPVASHLLDPDYLDRYRAEVSGHASALRGTTHIGVIDKQGNVAAMTVSNGEGCGTMVPGTGIMLNNMLGEEDLNPDGFHRWPENQRMTSMMAPSLVSFAGERLVAIGSGGSNRIRTAVLQVLLNLIDHGMGLERAVWSPRIHFEGGQLNIESGFDPTAVRELERQYENARCWESRNLFFGGAHCVEREVGGLNGAGDPRRGGACRVVPG